MLRYFLDKNGVLTYRREGREAHFVSTLLRNLGSTEKDKNELERMGLKFDYPKPRKLINYLTGLYSKPGDIVLDSFAGSGTTGHAVLCSGIEDLRFVLVEMDQRNATEVVAPRLRMAINGYTPVSGQNANEPGTDPEQRHPPMQPLCSTGVTLCFCHPVCLFSSIVDELLPR